MKHLLLLITIFLINIPSFADTQQISPTPIQEQLTNLEKTFNGKIGVYAINTNNNQIIAYRANEHFPVQ